MSNKNCDTIEFDEIFAPSKTSETDYRGWLRITALQVILTQKFMHF